MCFDIIIRGFAIGFGAVMPLGPVAVLCLQRTLGGGFRRGFRSALGSAAADVVYAVAAFFSLSLVSAFVSDNIKLLKIAGGAVIVLVGLRVALTSPVLQIRRARAGGGKPWSDFMSVLGLSFANPLFIMTYIALFAAFGLSLESVGAWGGVALTAGILIGESCWWLLLTAVAGMVRSRIRPRHFLWINRAAGAAIMALGLSAMASIFFKTPVDGIM